MDAEIIKWQNLRSQADEVIKQTLAVKKDSQHSHDGSRIANALAIYVKSDHTIKALQMNQKRSSQLEN